jgi:hypothetical protein
MTGINLKNVAISATNASLTVRHYTNVSGWVGDKLDQHTRPTPVVSAATYAKGKFPARDNISHGPRSVKQWAHDGGRFAAHNPVSSAVRQTVRSVVGHGGFPLGARGAFSKGDFVALNYNVMTRRPEDSGLLGLAMTIWTAGHAVVGGAACALVGAAVGAIFDGAHRLVSGASSIEREPYRSKLAAKAAALGAGVGTIAAGFSPVFFATASGGASLFLLVPYAGVQAARLTGIVGEALLYAGGAVVGGLVGVATGMGRGALDTVRGRWTAVDATV